MSKHEGVKYLGCGAHAQTHESYREILKVMIGGVCFQNPCAFVFVYPGEV